MRQPEDSRRHVLQVMAAGAGACKLCRLYEKRTRVVFASGDPYAELVFVGEGPGADEDASGEPFVGASGRLLNKMIEAMGYQRSEVYVCNVVKCRPPENRKPAPNEVDACKPYLISQLEHVKPKVIVALGMTAGEVLVPKLFSKFGDVRGKVFDLPSGAKLIPTFHPAYCLRVQSSKATVWEDLKIACEILGKTPINTGAGRVQATN